MLPYFFRHFDELVDEYFVYDNGSTDNSLDLLRGHGRVHVEHFDVAGDSFVDEERRLGNEIWKRSRGKADWVIITDIDEHLYRPDLLGYLARCREEGITAIKSFGYEMVADAFPTQEDKLVNLVTRGCRSAGLNRLCIFNPDAITATHFGPGRHQAWPEGHVVWPASSEVLLLHYKQMGVDYLITRSAQLSQGMKSGDIENGWGGHYHWSNEAITEHWAKTKAESATVPGLGELSHIPPEEYRGDEKIVEQSGLLDYEWYLANNSDVAVILSDALTHYCRYGWKEGRQPNFYFDPAWYERTYPHAGEGEINPLVHYIREGEKEGNCPSRFFDTGWYRQEHGLGPEESPLRHYLARRGTGLVSPLPIFDVEAYCKAHPDVLTLGHDPFEDSIKRRQTQRELERIVDYPDFVAVAQKLGLDPRSDLYPANVPWRSVLDLIRLFLTQYPVDEAWYRITYPDVDAAITSGDLLSAKSHFIENGFFEGRSFRPSAAPAEEVDPKLSVISEESHGST
jgi:hypothetical protein